MHSKSPPRICNPLTALLLTAVVSCVITSVHGFASFLKCYVDFEDAEEVIMNHPIQAHTESPHNIIVQVKRADWPDDAWTTESTTYPANQVTTWEARLVYPPDGPEYLGKTEYVMETVGGVFDPPTMCDGRRIPSKGERTVVLKVDGTKPNVELFAGWAYGKQAVTLTPRIVLTREDESSNEL